MEQKVFNFLQRMQKFRTATYHGWSRKYLSYVDAPSGAVWRRSDKVIMENGTTMTTNYTVGTTFGSTCNGGSFR